MRPLLLVPGRNHSEYNHYNPRTSSMSSIVDRIIVPGSWDVRQKMTNHLMG